MTIHSSGCARASIAPGLPSACAGPPRSATGRVWLAHKNLREVVARRFPARLVALAQLRTVWTQRGGSDRTPCACQPEAKRLRAEGRKDAGNATRNMQRATCEINHATYGRARAWTSTKPTAGSVVSWPGRTIVNGTPAETRAHVHSPARAATQQIIRTKRDATPQTCVCARMFCVPCLCVIACMLRAMRCARCATCDRARACHAAHRAWVGSFRNASMRSRRAVSKTERSLQSGAIYAFDARRAQSGDSANHSRTSDRVEDLTD